MSYNDAVVGIADHNGWAVLVTVDLSHNLIDRRRVELLDDGLPPHPHHHQGQVLPLGEALTLIEKVRTSAQLHATACFEALTRELSTPIVSVAIRKCPPMPATVAERITDYKSQNVADSVMYREALAEAAAVRGWRVYWYQPKTVFADACEALQRNDIGGMLEQVGRSLGPPWRQDHKVAMAAAIAARTTN